MLFATEPRWTVTRRYMSATIFALGIMMLAKSTISESGQPVGDQRRITPSMMVSGALPAAVVVTMTGRRFAGT